MEKKITVEDMKAEIMARKGYVMQHYVIALEEAESHNFTVRFGSQAKKAAVNYIQDQIKFANEYYDKQLGALKVLAK